MNRTVVWMGDAVQISVTDPFNMAKPKEVQAIVNDTWMRVNIDLEELLQLTVTLKDSETKALVMATKVSFAKGS